VIELGRGISASLGAVGGTCAVAVTAGVIKATVPANSAISTGIHTFFFICIPYSPAQPNLPLRFFLRIRAEKRNIAALYRALLHVPTWAGK
jgi:hypothetical protein